ncbi:Phosphinothricin N-acetyltransferase [bioreactor metagenome]|uniref:Phosphinothricin N-acetyltransferase n=1 Tax=bioreactor metagenome TaxID=1076179 RepID=A0A645EHD8_9ZZZZ
MKQNEFHIRLATPNDGGSVAEIYNHYIANSTATFAEEPYPPEKMAEKIRRIREEHGVYLLVEAGDGAVAGFACADAFRNLGANRLAELSIYFAPPYTGRGWGEPLLKQLIAELRNDRFYAGLMAVITADNGPSLRFHRRFGFLDAGQWKNAACKHSRWCDVQVLQFPLFTPVP